MNESDTYTPLPVHLENLPQDHCWLDVIWLVDFLKSQWHGSVLHWCDRTVSLGYFLATLFTHCNCTAWDSRRVSPCTLCINHAPALCQFQILTTGCFVVGKLLSILRGLKPQPYYCTWCIQCAQTTKMPPCQCYGWEWSTTQITPVLQCWSFSTARCR